jgi:hypothetical protein
MGDEEKARFLIRFVEWLRERDVAVPSDVDVYRFMEYNR